ncbi:enoyl-CoA hydratase-related protein [Chelativorans sp. AA-79]|uniref:enoyl-CoA hydratase/isomerase family protein n=1 Tax=Chelativorans sp. AA-79 TaxID=3028735 RepID=UPI0023F93C4F|nr:enoyl-CoA hydratase-related protein [Chelativorans sp. AA-79]WEX12458.1 enoyl-CoA hydratase-related protein [Chelativorans sp. AA-79]
MSDEKYILFETDEHGVATLTLNRPEKYNAFIPEMLTQWREKLAEARDDPKVHVVVLTGAGKAFCAGGDSGKMADRATENALTRKDFLWRQVHEIPLLLDRFEKPIIAAINGAARGAGLDMALMCDIRYMAESANVAESYINVGMIAGDGGGYYLPRLIGLDHALEICLTGRVVGSAEAKALGMVTHVVPDEELLPAAYKLARTIAEQPQAAIRMYKRSLYQSLSMTLSAHLDMVSSHTSVLRETPEHRERVERLRNKTLPKAS